MEVHNYYLVAKETGKVHALFRVNPSFMAKDGKPEAWMAGRLYWSDPTYAFTLPELYALNSAEDPTPALYDYPGAHVFEFIGEIHYAAYKGYRLYNFANMQRSHDFAGNDLMELNAFLTTLYRQFIGENEVSFWGEEMFVDKYGVNAAIMEHFTIQYDNHEGIHLDPWFRDDTDWEGFKHS